MIHLLLKPSLYRRTGQSLIEVIIGVAIAGIFILAAGNLVNVTIISNVRNKQIQTGVFLAEELMENVSSYADAKWYCLPSTCAATKGIYNLNKGSSRRYYTTSTPFTSFEWREDLTNNPNGESISISDQNYNRYFFVENVCRNQTDGSIVGAEISGSCAAGTIEDSSTQKVTVVVRWLTNAQETFSKLEKYISRIRNAGIGQTDWSGGGGQSGIFSDQIKYDTDDGNINFSAVPGSIKINGY